MATKLSCDGAFGLVHHRNHGVGIEQKACHLNSALSSGRCCSETGSRAASTASPSSRARVSSHAQFDSTGSRMMRRPRRSMRICSASTRNACGKRTACDRPVQKTLAVSIVFCLSIRSMHLIHTNYTYCIYYTLHTPYDRRQHTTFGAAAISMKYFKAPAAAPSDDSRATRRATTPSRRR